MSTRDERDDFSEDYRDPNGEHDHEHDHDHDHDHDRERHWEGEEGEVVFEQEVPILTVSAGDNERGGVFRDLLSMRNEAAFCDVAFLVQGTLFRAHRVVVSSWSRWLFALLSEGPDQEIVSLDVFSPQEFGSVLDYMYGEPLEFTLANAEHMLKIVRRLELRVVEQKCWRFLLSIVSHENCVQLHQLADFFECAPLKISAWRIIQESKPGYSAAPSHMINSMQVNGSNAYARRSHGLTGPGEMNTLPNHNTQDDDDSDDDEAEFSIFTGTTQIVSGTEQSEVPGEGLLTSVSKRYDHYVHPDKLPKGTPALQVVKAWSFRLQEVFAECCDRNEDMMSIAQHAGLSAAASHKSETESEHTESEVRRSLSAFSDTSSVANRVMSNPTSSSTPVLSQQPRPSVSHTRRTPRGDKPSQQHQAHRSSQFQKNDETRFYEEEDEGEEEQEPQRASTRKSSPPSTLSHPPLDWRQELTDFYTANNLHEKIQSIDAILEAWNGRELDMMEVLHDKYRIDFDDRLRDRLSSQ